jgi:hypothetical protein
VEVPYVQLSALWNTFSLEDRNEQSVEQNGLKAETKPLLAESRGFRLYVGSGLGAAFSFVEHV